MRYVLLFLLLSICSASELGRLNPHGKKELSLLIGSKKDGCLTCHYMSKKKIGTYPDSNKRCISCHNKYPHSGIIEHLGKDLSKHGLKGKMNCLSCHATHYRNALPVPAEKSFIHANYKHKIGRKYQIKRTGRPMLSRECTDCHSRKNLR